LDPFYKIGSRFSGFPECGEEKELGGPLPARVREQICSSYRIASIKISFFLESLFFVYQKIDKNNEHK
jgi:hypothetical protein